MHRLSHDINNEMNVTGIRFLFVKFCKIAILEKIIMTYKQYQMMKIGKTLHKI